MYTIYITGYGAEVTQGIIPLDTVDQIYRELTEDQDFESYIAETDWFEIDDNFHGFGAFLDASSIEVTDATGSVIYRNECTAVQKSTKRIDDMYPEDIEVPGGILTCIDKQKGSFLESTLGTEYFNPDLLKIHVHSLGDVDLIVDISYDNQPLTILNYGDTISKDFVANLEI
jgi:hypothetical protein